MTTMKKDSKPDPEGLVRSPSDEITVVHHDRAVWEERETYGPPGKVI